MTDFWKNYLKVADPYDEEEDDWGFDLNNPPAWALGQDPDRCENCGTLLVEAGDGLNFYCPGCEGYCTQHGPYPLDDPESGGGCPACVDIAADYCAGAGQSYKNW